MSGYTRRDVLKAAGSVGILAASSSPFSAFASSGVLGKIDPKIHMHKSYNMNALPSGTVINESNYKNFPELEYFLPGVLFSRLKRGATVHDMPFPITIVPTRELRFSEDEQKADKANLGKVKLSPNNDKLINYAAGTPFPEPKNIHEVSWNFSRRRNWGDSSKYYIYFIVIDKLNRRKDVAFTYYQKPFVNRVTLPPVPSYSNTDVDWKATTVFTKPYDAAGFAILRVRYIDFEKNDDSWAYMPAIRRLRRFTGADVQDPLFGTDVNMDDYANFEQKIDYKNMYPESIELGKYLLPTSYSNGFDAMKIPFDGKFINLPVELRKYYKLTYKCTDPNYMYGKRVMYIDVDNSNASYGEFFDQKGKIYRTWRVSNYWTENSERSWEGIEVLDWANRSKTFILFNSEPTKAPYNLVYSDSVFTTEFLKQTTR